MDRSEVVRISRLILSNKLTIADVIILLKAYCVEHGKPEKETESFIEFLLQTTELDGCIKHTLKYYEQKFGIIKILSKPDSYGHRTVIHIN